jgi:hypothetical protein
MTAAASAASTPPALRPPGRSTRRARRASRRNRDAPVTIPISISRSTASAYAHATAQSAIVPPAPAIDPAQAGHGSAVDAFRSVTTPTLSEPWRGESDQRQPVT